MAESGLNSPLPEMGGPDGSELGDDDFGFMITPPTHLENQGHKDDLLLMRRRMVWSEAHIVLNFTLERSRLMCGHVIRMSDVPCCEVVHGDLLTTTCVPTTKIALNKSFQKYVTEGIEVWPSFNDWCATIGGSPMDPFPVGSECVNMIVVAAFKAQNCTKNNAFRFNNHPGFNKDFVRKVDVEPVSQFLPGLTSVISMVENRDLHCIEGNVCAIPLVGNRKVFVVMGKTRMARNGYGPDERVVAILTASRGEPIVCSGQSIDSELMAALEKDQFGNCQPLLRCREGGCQPDGELENYITAVIGVSHGNRCSMSDIAGVLTNRRLVPHPVVDAMIITLRSARANCHLPDHTSISKLVSFMPYYCILSTMFSPQTTWSDTEIARLAVLLVDTTPLIDILMSIGSIGGVGGCPMFDADLAAASLLLDACANESDVGIIKRKITTARDHVNEVSKRVCF